MERLNTLRSTTAFEFESMRNRILDSDNSKTGETPAWGGIPEKEGIDERVPRDTEKTLKHENEVNARSLTTNTFRITKEKQ